MPLECINVLGTESNLTRKSVEPTPHSSRRRDGKVCVPCKTVLADAPKEIHTIPGGRSLVYGSEWGLHSKVQTFTVPPAFVTMRGSSLEKSW